MLSNSDSISGRRFFLLCWIALAAILISAHWQYYFVQPHFELGDFAANSLQIRNAKFFREMYGNYSRWGFHHPGPAFFYAYAAGEFLLKDILHLVRSPTAAHQLVGVLIQTGFFVWTLLIVQKHVAGRVIVPLLLFLGALHFGAVNHYMSDKAFESIWPPNVLLFPFLCFTVACASVATGSIAEVVAAMLSGCLLVHGHVAQPLFVVPFFLIAVVAAFLQSRRSRTSSRAVPAQCRRVLVTAAIILSIFLLPLLVDATGGDHSNLRLIFAHFTTHSDDHKTLGQSLAYFVSFMCYVATPEIYCAKQGWERLAFLSDHWPFAAAWGLILGFLCLRARALVACWSFTLWLSIYFTLGLILTIVWGTLQNGQMFNFNSFFNFGLLFVALIIAAVGVCRRPVRRRAPPIAMAGIYSATAVAFFFTARGFRLVDALPEPGYPTNDIPGVTQFAPLSSPRQKLLLFQHDDWPWAVGLALALKRSGFDYAISPDWQFMFGEGQGVDPSSAIRDKHLPAWRLQRDRAECAGFTMLGGPYVRATPCSVDPAKTVLTFGGDCSAKKYALFGWDLSDGPFSWSDASDAVLYFVPEQTDEAVSVRMRVFPINYTKAQSQRMPVYFNGEKVADFTLTAETELTVEIPANKWNSTSLATLAFRFPDAASPQSLHVSIDPRLLGVGFREISFSQRRP